MKNMHQENHNRKLCILSLLPYFSLPFFFLKMGGGVLEFPHLLLSLVKTLTLQFEDDLQIEEFK